MTNDRTSTQAERTPVARLLSPKELAAYLGVPVATIYRWRSLGEGPVGCRVGRHVRYRREDIEAWLLRLAAADERRPSGA